VDRWQKLQEVKLTMKDYRTLDQGMVLIKAKVIKEEDLGFPLI